MANNVTVKDASGLNQTFSTWFDAGSSTHRSQVVDNLAVANAYVSNTNPVPILQLAANSSATELVFNNQDSTANLVTFTAANTSTVITQSSNQTNFNWRGAIFYLNITAVAGATANVSVTVNNIDPVSGKYYPVLVTPATTTNVAQSNMYTVYPGISGSNNAGLPLSRTWSANITVTGVGTNTVTGRLTATMMV